jgi:hypothetical protein
MARARAGSAALGVGTFRQMVELLVVVVLILVLAGAVSPGWPPVNPVAILVQIVLVILLVWLIVSLLGMVHLR